MKSPTGGNIKVSRTQVNILTYGQRTLKFKPEVQENQGKI